MTLAMVWACYALLPAQQFSDNQTISVDLSQVKVLRLHNLYGKVRVKATTGRTATIRARRLLRSSSTQRLNTAKQEVYLDSMLVEGNLIFFIEAPNWQFEIDENGDAHYDGWGNKSGNDKKSKIFEVKFEFDIELEVPAQTDLYVSTHEEELEVTGMRGQLYAKNHHNSIKLTDIGGNATVKTHHGDIELSYSRNPTGDCSYKTHHGDIKIYYQQALSADVSLDSHHGEFYTDFDWKPKPVEVSRKAASKGTTYFVGKGTHVRIGSGGIQQNFKTHHGDIYLLTKSR